jgi:hypothetical protein
MGSRKKPTPRRCRCGTKAMGRVRVSWNDGKTEGASLENGARCPSTPKKKSPSLNARDGDRGSPLEDAVRSAGSSTRDKAAETGLAGAERLSKELEGSCAWKGRWKTGARYWVLPI